ncbi:MAG: TetR family transcriptional regulator [Actinobacteria bacterium]|nr:TetR family transcriptional regulator [Actinomycetota bacterium]
MGRWIPGARARLGEAAIELYAERGFEQTMVSEIAERAGVTARTFFRHYTDKREVLFAGWSSLQEATADALETAPADASAMELVRLALDATAQIVASDPARARTRQAIIAATPELHERELIKFDTLAKALADNLHHRGFDPTEAELAARTGLAIYRTAFDRWAETDGDSTLTEAIDAVAERHRRLTLESPHRPPGDQAV